MGDQGMTWDELVSWYVKEGFSLEEAQTRARETLTEEEHPGGVVLLSAATYPAIYRAFKLIALDNGMGVRDSYELPPWHDPAEWRLPVIEAALAALSEEDLDTLCSGEQEDLVAIAERSEELGHANELLGAFFEGGPG
jgi:hypothetical protein